MPGQHILIIGAGAIGSVIAARLTSAGSNITLVARNRRLAHLRDRPVELASGKLVETVMVQAADWDGLRSQADVCILCTKTGDLAEALTTVAAHLAPAPLVITLQNGVDAPGQAASALPGSAVVAGRVHGFFELVGSGVRHVGVTPSVELGGINPDGRHREREAVDILARAGFSARASDNIIRELWKKLMLTAGLGAVGAALGVPAGQVLDAPCGRALLRAALAELASVGNACGASLRTDDIDQALAFIAGFPSGATTSLQRDLAHEARSEYTELVGTVIRLASVHGQPVPTFAKLDARIRRRFPALASASP